MKKGLIFGGMLAAALVGIFVIPMLYVVFQSLRERVSGKGVAVPAAPEGPAAHPSSS